MTKNTIARARIDDPIKKEAVAVLSEIGLTASEDFRFKMNMVTKENALLS
jgi:antitoxin component of RelBE/YafQ-DinJ toxin-antitoxin module